MAVTHHTKQKGDLGVLKAQVDLFEQGFTILAPLTEHSPFNLVAYREFGSNATLRVEAPKNGQLKNIKFAADYRRVP